MSIINLNTNVGIKVEIIKRDGTKYDISELVEDITWSGDYKSCGRKLEFSIIASNTDINIPKVNIELGEMVIFYTSKELFRGYITDRERNSSDSSIDFIAFDKGFYINENKGAYNFKSITAESIANKICDEFKIPKGRFATTNINIDKVFIGASLYDIIMTAYTEASKKTNKKYMMICEGDKISVIEKGTIVLDINFEEGNNLIETSFKESIQKMVNKVIIVDENGNKKDEVVNEEWMKLYGTLQDVVKVEENKDNKIEANSKMNGIERSCSLSGYGDTSCICGYGIKIKDSFAGLMGLFYIDSDTHNFSNGEYSIDLELSFQNIMDEKSAGQEEKEEKGTNNSSETSVVGGKEFDAEFTAYYPANNSMQGGLYDAMGNKLDPSKLTCAAPKEVDFGTRIQVKDTGTSRDGIVYKCTDRGGAIKIVNGVYHIDLLMATKDECYKFGRRKGKALIGCEVVENNNSNSNTSDNSKVDKMIQLAKGKVGNKYIWGHTGPNTFDCSGFTQWLHKQVGISTPRVSKDQSKSGKSVSRANIQAGDLVFFNTSGKGVSHVGFMISSTQMIHAANSKKGVRYDNIDSGYYKARFVNARRYV